MEYIFLVLNCYLMKLCFQTHPKYLSCIAMSCFYIAIKNNENKAVS